MNFDGLLDLGNLSGLYFKDFRGTFEITPRALSFKSHTGPTGVKIQRLSTISMARGTSCAEVPRFFYFRIYWHFSHNFYPSGKRNIFPMKSPAGVKIQGLTENFKSRGSNNFCCDREKSDRRQPFPNVSQVLFNRRLRKSWRLSFFSPERVLPKAKNFRPRILFSVDPKQIGSL